MGVVYRYCHTCEECMSECGTRFYECGSCPSGQLTCEYCVKDHGLKTHYYMADQEIEFDEEKHDGVCSRECYLSKCLRCMPKKERKKKAGKK
jgi:hypothetical protein